MSFKFSKNIRASPDQIPRIATRNRAADQQDLVFLKPQDLAANRRRQDASGCFRREFHHRIENLEKTQNDITTETEEHFSKRSRLERGDEPGEL